jgi:hypothetical protein
MDEQAKINKDAVTKFEAMVSGTALGVPLNNGEILT